MRADECPHYTEEFLANELASMGDRWFNQEYCAIFSDTIDALFSAEDIIDAMSGEVRPLFMKR